MAVYSESGLKRVASTRARRDLILITIVVATICIAILSDPDRFFEWLAQRREAQFDESLLTMVVVGIGFAIFSWRRWADLSRQVAEYQLLQKELSAVNREAVRLSETDDLLQACLSAEEAYRVVSNHFESELPKLSGVICEITPAKDFVEVRVQWGAPSLASRLFPPEDCWGLRRGRVKLFNAGASKLVCAHIGTALPAYAICVPMMAQGETLGVLYLDQIADGATKAVSASTLSESQQRMITTLAEHLALAVANLNLRERLRMQSIRDPLTDLFNRRYMEEAVDRELHRSVRKQTPLAVMMVDIDHFKQFNDAFGHEAGDIVLQRLAKLFAAHLRAEDIACRYGGEEFTLILPEVSLESARQRGEQLCGVVRLTDVEIRSRPLPRLTISIGIACYPQHGATQEALLQAADRALYQAKKEGRDRVAVA